MLSMLQVVIGVIFVLLLLSLLATTAMEWIASLLKLRGRNLERALRNMLASSDTHEAVYHKFLQNSMYRQLTKDPNRPSSRPSYMSSDTFQTILLDILCNDGASSTIQHIEKAIDQLPDADLKEVLRTLVRDSGDDIGVFKVRVQDWYDKVMDRASGWYKRNTQRILLLLGCIIAVLFNADTLAIYQSLEKNPEQLKVVLGMADEFLQRDYRNYTPYLESQSTPGAPAATSPQADSVYREATREVMEQLRQELETVKAPLGMGWHSIRLAVMGPEMWLTKLLGWFVTALAISLGAPFWFDLLRKITNIRSSGKKE